MFKRAKTPREPLTAKSAARGVGNFFVGGRTCCCCCVPIRFGVIFFSGLTVLATGLLSIILFFEVATNHDATFSQRDRTAFIVGGIFQILLCIASVLGFIGAIARKFSFVLAYSVMLYVDLLANVGAGAFVMARIDRTTSKDKAVLCYEAIRDPGGQKQCSGALNITRGTLIGVIVALLVVETYVALAVTRYVRILRREQKEKQAARVHRAHTPSASAWSDDDDDEQAILKHRQRTSYDPSVRTPSYDPSHLHVPSYETATHFPLRPQFLEEKVGEERVPLV